MLVTSRDGRPVKIEGNPAHPSSAGATSVWAQASVLSLYDPDRSRGPRYQRDGRGRAASWEEFTAAARSEIEGLGDGQGLGIIAPPSSSPCAAELRAAFLQRFPRAVWVEYEPLLGSGKFTGRPRFNLTTAKVIVVLDDDPLVDHPNGVVNARRFAAGRAPDGPGMNRLYVCEPGYTATGTMADHRIPIAAAHIEYALVALADRLFRHQDLALPSGAVWPVGGARVGESELKTIGLTGEQVDAMAQDLAHHRGHGLVHAGPRQPARVHALCRLINDALGNTDRTIHYPDAGSTGATADGVRRGLPGLRAMTDAMRAGEIRHLLMLGVNPVYDAPPRDRLRRSTRRGAFWCPPGDSA